jgi:hypothetical protein
VPLPPDKKEQFERVAAQARAELEKHWQEWSAVDVAAWIRRWTTSGSKREQATSYDAVCRALIDVTGVSKLGVSKWTEYEDE